MKRSVARLVKSGRRVQLTGKLMSMGFTLCIAILAWANTTPKATPWSITFNTFIQIAYLAIIIVDLKKDRIIQRHLEFCARLALATSTDEFEEWINRLTLP